MSDNHETLIARLGKSLGSVLLEREAATAIAALVWERDSLSRNLDGARGCLKETEAEVARLKAALESIATGSFPGAVAAAISGDLEAKLQEIAREALGVGVKVRPPEIAGPVCKWVELQDLAAFNEVGRQWRTGCGKNVADGPDALRPSACPFCKGEVI